MNERINELKHQASLWCDMNIPEKFSEDGYGSAWEDKFAELIVRECMNQVREQYLPVLEDELMMKDTHWDGYVQCGVDSYVAVKEHFGVEE